MAAAVLIALESLVMRFILLIICVVCNSGQYINQ